MESTKSLPESYDHYLNTRPGDYRKAHLCALLNAIPLKVGIYFLSVLLPGQTG